MRIIPCGVLVVHLAAGVASAQTFNDLQIRLGAYTVSSNGGEKPVGVWRSTGPVVIGKPVISTYSVGEACEAFAVSSDGSLREDATAAWKIELTPMRVVGDAVTFRLRWQMAGSRLQRDGQRNRMSLEFSEAFPANDVLELTLRPGESWPVYTCEISTDILATARRRSECQSTTFRGRRPRADSSLPISGSLSGCRTALRHSAARLYPFAGCPTAHSGSTSIASSMGTFPSTFTASS